MPISHKNSDFLFFDGFCVRLRRTMAGFKFKLNGVEITVASREDAAGLLLDMTKSGGGEKSARKLKPAPVTESGFPVAQTAREFLTAMQSAGSTGIDTKRVLKIVGVSEP